MKKVLVTIALAVAATGAHAGQYEKGLKALDAMCSAMQQSATATVEVRNGVPLSALIVLVEKEFGDLPKLKPFATEMVVGAYTTTLTPEQYGQTIKHECIIKYKAMLDEAAGKS